MKLSTLSHLVQIARSARTPAKDKGKQRSASDPGLGNGSRPLESPPSPSSPRAARSPTMLRSMSGDAPLTHQALRDAAVSDEAIERRAKLVHVDEFICDPEGGVDAKRLLVFARRSLLTKATLVGCTALVDEEWTCTILRPKRRGQKIRVIINYTAVAAKCSTPDPQVPVAIQEAQGIPGLMTVIERL